MEASEDNAPGEASDDDGGAGGETGANGETGAVDSNPLKMTRFAELPINDKLKACERWRERRSLGLTFITWIRAA